MNGVLFIYELYSCQVNEQKLSIDALNIVNVNFFSSQPLIYAMDRVESRAKSVRLSGGFEIRSKNRAP